MIPDLCRLALAVALLPAVLPAGEIIKGTVIESVIGTGEAHHIGFRPFQSQPSVFYRTARYEGENATLTLSEGGPDGPSTGIYLDSIGGAMTLGRTIADEEINLPESYLYGWVSYDSLAQTQMGNAIGKIERSAGRIESNTTLRAVMATTIAGNHVESLRSGASIAFNARALAPGRMAFYAGTAFPLARDPDPDTGESFLLVIFPSAAWYNPGFSTSSNDHAGSANPKTSDLAGKLAAGRIRVESPNRASGSYHSELYPEDAAYGDGGWRRYTLGVELSDEDTLEDAMAAVDWQTERTTNVESISFADLFSYAGLLGDADTRDVWVRTCKIRITVADYCSRGHFHGRVTLERNFEGNPDGEVVIETPVSITDPNAGADAFFEFPVEKSVVYTLKSITLERMPVCGSCRFGQPKAGSTVITRADGIGFDLHLGETADDRYPAVLQMAAETITPDLFQPSSLQLLASSSANLDVTRVAGAIRQVNTPGGFIDVATIGDKAYRIASYPISADEGLGEDGLRRFSGLPSTEVRISNPTPSATDGIERLQVLRVTANVEVATVYAQDPASGTLTVSEGDGLRVTERQVLSEDEQEKRVLVTVRGPDRVPVSSTIERHLWTDAGWALVEMIDDPGGRAVRRVHNRVTDPDRKLTLDQAEGLVQTETYDPDSGRLIESRRHFGVGTSELTAFSVSSIEDLDGDGVEEELTTVRTTFEGESPEVERTQTPLLFRLRLSRPVEAGTKLLVETRLITATARDASWDDADNLVTIERTIDGGRFHGNPTSTLEASGLLRTISYEEDPDTGGLTVTTDEGEPSENLSSVVRGLRTAVTRNRSGEIISELNLDIETGLVTSRLEVEAVDTSGRPFAIRHYDGSLETRSYNECCGLMETTTRHGLTTHHEYDALGRQTREWVTDTDGNVLSGLRREYDAADRITATFALGEGVEELPKSSWVYDLAGDAISETDSMGRMTRFAQTLPGFDREAPIEEWPAFFRETRVERPDGGTEIRTYGPGGDLIEVSGTAANPRQVTYGETTAQDSPFGVEATWHREEWPGSDEASTTWFNTLGQDIGTTHADGSRDIRFYDERGLLAKTVDRDGVVELILNDTTGRERDLAIDMNRNDQIDYAGSDRIVRTVTDYVEAHETVVKRSRTSIWEIESEDTPREIERVERSVDGRREWLTVNGLTRWTETLFNEDGSQINRVGFPDSGTLTTVSLNGRVFSEKLVADEIVLSDQTFTHDDFGRVTSKNDAGTGRSLFAYFDDGQLRSSTSPDPDPDHTGAGVDPLVHTYAYDAAGRLSVTTLPDGSIQRTTYSPHGRVIQQRGGRDYPVDYVYDDQGRLTTLATWSDFENDGGRAVTRWHRDPATGRLLYKTYPSGNGPTYVYSAAGRIRRRTWARQVDGEVLSTDYAYDAAGDLVGIDHSHDTPDVTMVHDRAGRLTAIHDAAGRRTMIYGAKGLQTTTTYETNGILSGLTLGRTFDANERVGSLSVEQGNEELVSIGFSYGPGSRLEQVHLGDSDAHYVFTPSSDRVATIRFARDGDALRLQQRTHDALGRLTALTSGREGDPDRATRMELNAAGQRTEVRSDALSWSFKYDGFGQLIEAAQQTESGEALGGRAFGFRFDAIGNRRQSSLPDWDGEWATNADNQLVRRDVPDFAQVTGRARPEAIVSIDGVRAERQEAWFHGRVPVDNSSGPVNVSVEVTAVVNGVGEADLDAVATEERPALVRESPEVFRYDADGNLMEDGRWIYEWDAENRLISVQTLPTVIAAGAPPERVEYQYDSAHRRIGRRVLEYQAEAWVATAETVTLYDGMRPVADFDRMNGDRILRTYAWGLDISDTREGAGGIGGLALTRIHDGDQVGTYAVDTDERGNVTAYIRMSDGEVTVQREYGPFGEPLQGHDALDAFPFAFGTKRTDSVTGLSDFGYRIYDPTSGRWLSRDPIEESGGPNLYAYAGNDPIANTDRDGLHTYGFAGTWENVNAANPKFEWTNVRDFIERLDRSELGQYFPGVGARGVDTPLPWQVLQGVSAWEEYSIVKTALERICRDRKLALRSGLPYKVNLVGWSRGATSAIWTAKELGEIGCSCDGGRSAPVDVNAVILYDSINMHFSAPAIYSKIPGMKRMPWYHGPPNSVPGNVQNFFHAQRSGPMIDQSLIPMDTVTYGHGSERSYSTRQPYREEQWANYKIVSYLSSHNDIGVSPSATEAFRESLEFAKRVGIPIDTSVPYKHKKGP